MNAKSHMFNFGFENRVEKGGKVKHKLRVTLWKFIFTVTSLDL